MRCAARLAAEAGPNPWTASCSTKFVTITMRMQASAAVNAPAEIQMVKQYRSAVLGSMPCSRCIDENSTMRSFSSAMPTDSCAERQGVQAGLACVAGAGQVHRKQQRWKCLQASSGLDLWLTTHSRRRSMPHLLQRNSVGSAGLWEGVHTQLAAVLWLPFRGSGTCQKRRGASVISAAEIRPA